MVREYLPGPQAGSDSGKKKETAVQIPGPRGRVAAAATLAPPRIVLSITGCSGNPVGVWLGVRVDVTLGVRDWLPLRVCEAD